MSRKLKPLRYLLNRSSNWQYHRRVPSRYFHIDTRRFVRSSLHTYSLEIAQLRRDALEEADNAYWSALALAAIDSGNAVSEEIRAILEQRYDAATARAIAHGFTYKPAEELAQTTSVNEVMDRIKALEIQAGGQPLPKQAEIEALLGGTNIPNPVNTKISSAFEIYLKEIAFDQQYNKSPKQRHSWEKMKRTSLKYFIDVIGDMEMETITRDDAIKYRKWWMDRMLLSEENPKPAKPNTANRHIGNIRTLYTEFFTHRGDEHRDNPFRKMYFKAETRSEVPAFENDWVRSKILRPKLFDELRQELRLMIYILIETGTRMSEICNLKPGNIRLDCDVPYIAIRQRQNRELKTPDSRRDIPLVGVALDAMRLAPNGFPRYMDKGELVSANLMKAFRGRDLFPTDKHVIYSLRHAFEKRMLEAGIDYGLRCLLMGHKNTRPEYGGTGSMEFRRDELLKITHPYPEGLVH